MAEPNIIKEVVKGKYGQAALRVTSGGSSCCGASRSSGCNDLATAGIDAAAIASEVGGKFMSAFIRAVKPR